MILRKAFFCDAEGRLSTTAVAESPNGKRLVEILQEGVDVEVLSWKIEVDEPNAASEIRRAHNKAHELALRTTELTALATLKGEIIAQKGRTSASRLLTSLCGTGCTCSWTQQQMVQICQSSLTS